MTVVGANVQELDSFVGDHPPTKDPDRLLDWDEKTKEYSLEEVKENRNKYYLFFKRIIDYFKV
ncbi:MAG: hypothetical protein NUV46_00345 [Nanoarchaeota archaeon]|nr:hypothetical protein [Nanoarchaeota archaeon]